MVTAMKGDKYYAFECVEVLLKSGWSVEDIWMQDKGVGRIFLLLD